ncbi:MAG TPA: sensor histidine kinase [Actinomycetota bacterium]
MPKGSGTAGNAARRRAVPFARGKEEALTALVHQTIKVQEEERRRVATEIHDGVTQQLVSIWFRVHACQRLLERGETQSAIDELGTMKQAIDETLAETRNAIYNLRPATLDDLGLVPALHEFASRFQSETGIQCSIEAPGEQRFPPHLETALYRIAQEALANVRKHANAANAGVLLHTSAESVTLTVADDGHGFDVDAYMHHRPATSFGLAGMRERVELVGGRLTVRSAPGHGTQIRVTVPFDSLMEGAQ